MLLEQCIMIGLIHKSAWVWRTIPKPLLYNIDFDLSSDRLAAVLPAN